MSTNKHGMDFGVGAVNLCWKPAPTPMQPQEIRPHEIHLWSMGLAPLRETHLALLTPPEIARAERYRDHAQRAAYLGGRIGLRLLLSAYTGIANGDLRFAYGSRGKPSLNNLLPHLGTLSFNYSLSGGRALYALALNREVGIDLETLPREINAARLAERKLAAVERRAWRAVPPALRDRAMLACWTRKEAYGKALGVGIRYYINRAPLFTNTEFPNWQCAVTGLFFSSEKTAPKETAHDGRQLHGLQIAPPFPGIAALVYDGAALKSTGESLIPWRFSLQ